MPYSNRITEQPPPNTFIDIHIINENMPHLAHTVRLFLETRSYSERIPRIESKASFPDKQLVEFGIDIVIFEVDEFSDPLQMFEDLRAAYDEGVKFIAHSEHENEEIATLLVDAGVRGLATGWDFNQLADLIQEIAVENPVTKNSKLPKAT